MPAVQLFLSVFGVIFVAELPDKTALAALVLATRHKPLPVFLGAAAALTVQSAVAVGAGQLISLLPSRIVHIVAGVVFLISAVFMWLRKEDAKEEDASKRAARESFWRVTWSSFLVVFIAEWGDLTQIATAALAARYGAPLTVFVASSLALWAVAAIAVFIGNRARNLLDPILTQKIAAALFALIGVALVIGLL